LTWNPHWRAFSSNSDPANEILAISLKFSNLFRQATPIELIKLSENRMNGWKVIDVFLKLEIPIPGPN
jgi:hypothetical protein